MVDFQLGEAVGEVEEGFEFGDFSAGDVEGEASDGEVGGVFDGEARDGCRGLADDLAEGLQGVEKA